MKVWLDDEYHSDIDKMTVEEINEYRYIWILRGAREVVQGEWTYKELEEIVEVFNTDGVEFYTQEEMEVAIQIAEAESPFSEKVNKFAKNIL